MPRIALTALVVGLLAPTVYSATAARFGATSGTEGAGFGAGTVYLFDQDGGRAALAMANTAPGAAQASDVEVAYEGTLPSSVRLYGDVRGTGLDRFLTLTVTRGTGVGPAFAPDPSDYVGAGPGVLYAGTLANFPASYQEALVDPGVWNGSDAHTFRLTVTLGDDNAAQGRNALVDFHWEARNT